MAGEKEAGIAADTEEGESTEEEEEQEQGEGESTEEQEEGESAEELYEGELTEERDEGDGGASGKYEGRFCRVCSLLGVAGERFNALFLTDRGAGVETADGC